MSTAYVDTSCLVAIAFAEAGWESVARELEVFDALLSSTLLEAELRSVLEREGRQPLAEPLLAELSWVHPPRALSQELQRVITHGYLKGADLWHLACALYTANDPDELTFASLDQRQATVAAELGFRLLQVAEE